MKQIGRCILNGITVLSLLLCMATVALWVRSYSHYDLAFREASTGINTELISVNGCLTYSHFKTYLPQQPSPQEWGINSGSITSPVGQRIRIRFDGSASAQWWGQLGFYWHSFKPIDPGMTFRTVSMPHWSLVFVTASLPIVALRRWRRRHAGSTPRSPPATSPLPSP